MLPNLSLDTTLGRRKKLPDRRVEEGAPGCFSPRPSHSRSLSMVSSTHEEGAPAAAETTTAASHRSTYAAEPHHVRASEQRTAQTLTEVPPAPQTRGSSLEGFSRTLGVPTLPSAEPELELHGRKLRRSPPKVTLLDHQQARSSSASSLRVHAAAPCGDGDGGRAAASAHRTAIGSASVGKQLALFEAYVSGKPWRSIPESHRGGCGASALTISALATSSSGEYVALGDRSGRVFVMHRKQQQTDKDGGDRGVGNGRGVNYEAKGSTSLLREPYEFVVGRQAYTSVIDPLNSVEVTPSVQALSFLPQVGPTTYLLTANEKMPKLYKVIQVRESPTPFLAVDRLGEKCSGSLTLNPLRGSTTVAMKQVSRYALNHEYNINSLCPLADSAQFFSADDLTVKLWCVEYPDTSIETYSLRPPFDEEPQEVICSIRSFPHEPFLLFVLTSSGSIRVVDTRQTLKWFHQAPLVFRNMVCNEDVMFTSSLTDCALSPCGRYVAGRDVVSVCLWDIRRATLHDRNPRTSPTPFNHEQEHNVVRRWELYPHLRPNVEQYYQNELLDTFNVRFLNGREVCTGGYTRTLYILDTMKDDGALNGKSVVTPQGSGAKVLQLPVLQDAKNNLRGPLHSLAMGDVSFPAAEELDAEAGATVTQLSQPFTSTKGDCCMLASCGPALFQLVYTNVGC
ncbi:protein phosphatase 2A regulatory subunit [Trypanosoma grayi]|uniref:protein phosphatase 2A regulatory subunit n=1 Tax=Trypanosoma grayi TaxID=71804 RepID=UPI0004F46035|nr:protein phosphatase 2A regulatory subunit [Trypanosoma grayi]KEG15280.1 protein phosphatase 2A regulatory subunit [Trypanosoma grayi]